MLLIKAVHFDSPLESAPDIEVAWVCFLVMYLFKCARSNSSGATVSTSLKHALGQCAPSGLPICRNKNKVIFASQRLPLYITAWLPCYLRAAPNGAVLFLLIFLQIGSPLASGHKKLWVHDSSQEKNRIGLYFTFVFTRLFLNLPVNQSLHEKT